MLTGGSANISQTDRGIELSVPPNDRSDIDTVIELQLDQSVGAIEPVAVSASQK